jgi:hypothetical protein
MVRSQHRFPGSRAPRVVVGLRDDLSFVERVTDFASMRFLIAFPEN